MNRRLWTSALLGLTLLASPALAQQATRPAAAGTDIEKVRKNPDDQVMLNTFLSERFRAIGAALASDATRVRNGDAASIDGGHGSLVSGTEMNRETSCVPVSFLCGTSMEVKP